VAQNKLITDIRKRTTRNGSLFDIWSIVHLTMGVIMGWLIDPFIALALMVLWEPLEIFILSPLLAKKGILFGYETIRNSLSDIMFDVLGVAIGAWLLTSLLEPPFHLF
jgi:hypothetical protein